MYPSRCCRPAPMRLQPSGANHELCRSADGVTQRCRPAKMRLQPSLHMPVPLPRYRRRMVGGAVRLPYLFFRITLNSASYLGHLKLAMTYRHQVLTNTSTFLETSVTVRCALSTEIYDRGCHWIPQLCSLEALLRVTNGIPLGCSLPLTGSHL
jgi:hypothetical protein